MPSQSVGSHGKAPTILSYSLREQIATGGTSRVFRALHITTGELVAVKIVPLNSTAANAETEHKKVMKEFRIHETLKHRNILEVIAGVACERDGVWPEGLYIVMQLAAGGDLFDKIAPDLGVDEDIAHLYFRQLISGLKYIGKQGICHRDIKPENCLLDGNGNLKIADFGLAAVFKYKGRSRLLTDRCGSPPYAAPELANPAPYAGEPIDVWSAGILLFTLLVGNTPWDEPTPASPEFAAFIAGALVDQDPWNKIKGAAMDLLLRILEVDPARRMTIAQLEQMNWFYQPNPLIGDDGQCTDGAHVCQRLTAALYQTGHLGSPAEEFEQVMGLASQPPSSWAGGLNPSQRGFDPSASFQSSLRLYSKLSQAPSQRTNPNLTRFFSTTPLPHLLSALSAALASLRIPANVVSTREGEEAQFVARVRFQSRDKRGERMEGSLAVGVGFLPDGDEDEDGDEEMDGRERRGTKGFDVVMWKKSADPLELKRLWTAVIRKLPQGVVYAT